MQTHRLVKEALKAKAPQLHQQLADQGALTQYALDLAEQINSQVVTMTQADRARWPTRSRRPPPSRRNCWQALPRTLRKRCGATWR